MSLFQFTSRWLSIGPRIAVEHGRLHIRPGRIQSLLSLGSYRVTAVVDPVNRILTWRRRVAWLFTRTIHVSFDDLSHIDYGHRGVGTSWGWTDEGWGAHDEVEDFRLAVVAKDRTEYPLAWFSGEGAVSTGWIGTFLGDDDLFDLSGAQEGQSRVLCKALAHLMDIPVGLPYVDDDQFATCPACGQKTTRIKPVCLYCGAEIGAAED